MSTFREYFKSDVSVENLDIILENLSKFKYTDYTSTFPINCFLYIAYPLQWIHGRDAFDLSPLPRLPVDAPQTDPKSCDQAFRKLFGKKGYWPGMMLYDNFKTVLPGDIVIASVNNVPGHMMICGGNQKILAQQSIGCKSSQLRCNCKAKGRMALQTISMQ